MQESPDPLSTFLKGVWAQDWEVGHTMDRCIYNIPVPEMKVCVILAKVSIISKTFIFESPQVFPVDGSPTASSRVPRLLHLFFCRLPAAASELEVTVALYS